MKWILLLLLILPQIIQAQTVVVESKSEKIYGKKADGLQTTLLIADSRKVEKQWVNFLKGFGKVQFNDGIYTVEEAIIDGITASVTSTSNVNCYSRITLKTEGTEVWWAIEVDGDFVSQESNASKYNKAENYLHQFGVDVYVNEINEDIGEADRVIDNAVKEFERLNRQGNTLEKRLERNKYEKIKLEEKLVENASDSVQIVLQMEQNDLDIESAQTEIEKLKEARENIKGRLEDVK